VHGITRRPLAWSALALIVVTLAQVALGTQVREGIDEALALGIARGGALETVGRADWWHRDAALVVAFGTAWVLWLVWNRHRQEAALVRVAVIVGALVFLQIVLGLTMAYMSLTPVAQVAHLSGSSLLLGAQTVLFLLSRWLPEGEGTPAMVRGI
jgi:heme A synthase